MDQQSVGMMVYRKGEALPVGTNAIPTFEGVPVTNARVFTVLVAQRTRLIEVERPCQSLQVKKSDCNEIFQDHFFMTGVTASLPLRIGPSRSRHYLLAVGMIEISCHTDAG